MPAERSATRPDMDLARLVCLADYESAAQQCLPPEVWAWLDGAAGDGRACRNNQQAFERLEILPRVLRSAASGHTRLELLGRTYEHPIFIAPTATHALVHPDGEKATALAASALHAPYVVSTLSSVTLEDISQAAQCPLWFQLYFQPDRRVTLDLLRRAEQTACEAIVLTVDAPIQGLRDAERRAGFVLPPHVQHANLRRYAQAPAHADLRPGQSMFELPLVQRMPTWDDVAWLVAQSKLPVWLKGILHPLDVEEAWAVGACGIIVSNHGGRTLADAPATLDVLPQIVQAAAGRLPVLLDGGVRRGADVFKALSLGAHAVLLGRPVLHGLAVGGAQGLAHVLSLLLAELQATMILSACPDLKSMREQGCCRVASRHTG